MSGLCGIIDLEGGPVTAEAMRAMLTAGAHRGPDRAEIWFGEGAALGHLALDLAPEDHLERQPLVEAGLVLSADARIDNREELVHALMAAGEPASRDVGSARLILAAYRRWGTACPEHLLGDFAFAVWDSRERRLFAARDAMAMRPLYYRLTPTRLLFASEIGQLLACPGVPVDLDERMVAAHLTSQPSSLEWTFYRGIAQFPPGHALLVEPGRHRMWRYWDVDPEHRIRYRHDQDYAEHLRELFKEAVRCRLHTTRRVGLMLSGGVDSGSIAATAGWLLASERERLALPEFRAYCWAFEQLRECDERHVSRLITDRDRLPVTEILAEDALAEFPIHGLHCDEPSMLIYQALHERTYARAHEEGCGLMMSGIRGDLLVGLEPDLLGLLTAGQWREVGNTLRAESRSYLRLHRTAAKRLLLPALLSFWSLERLSAVRRWVWGRVTEWRRLRPCPDWLRPEFATSVRFAELAQPVEAPPGITASALRQRYESISAEIMVRVLVQMQRNCARFGIGFADPWSDRRLSEFVLAVPQWRLHQRSNPKRIVRLAMAGVMSDEARHRVGKTSLLPLYLHTLRGSRPAILDLITNSQAAARGYILEERVRDLYETICRTGRSLPGMWGILSLEMWLRRYWR